VHSLLSTHSELPLFLVPTGRRYSPAQSPYLGVEFLWNAHNYWVCMQVRWGGVGCLALQGTYWQPQDKPFGIPIHQHQPRLVGWLQMPRPNSDSHASPKDVSWALHDASKWQALLEDRSSTTRVSWLAVGWGRHMLPTASKYLGWALIASSNLGALGQMLGPGSRGSRHCVIWQPALHLCDLPPPPPPLPAGRG
jgi:hypothetical protein